MPREPCSAGKSAIVCNLAGCCTRGFFGRNVFLAVYILDNLGWPWICGAFQRPINPRGSWEGSNVAMVSTTEALLAL